MPRGTHLFGSLRRRAMRPDCLRLQEPGGAAAAAAVATLPASAVSAYDPAVAGNRVVGACVLDGSTQYGVTSSPPVTELGNGAAVVFGCRFKVVAGAAGRAAISFGDTTNDYYVTVDITGAEAVNIDRNAGSSDVTALTGSGSLGWHSAAVRFNADGTLDACVLAPGTTAVAWVNDATVRTLTAIDRFTVGARVHSAASEHWDDSVNDAYVSTAAAGVTKAAMEAFCLGADPADVGAANHWPMQSDFLDAIGSVDLTNTGSCTFSEAGADLVVNRDLTSSPTHANYCADVVGGALFGSANYLTSAAGAISLPNGSGFVTDGFWYVPDTTPTSQSTLISLQDDGGTHYAEITCHSAIGFRGFLQGAALKLSDIALVDAPGLYYICLRVADDGACTLWAGLVGGALVEGATSAGTTWDTIDQVDGIASRGTGDVAEAGTISSDVRVTALSAIDDVDKFVRARHRNWNTGDVPAATHAWTLDGAAGLLDSVGSADLTWSASAAYDDSLVASSHYNAMGVGSGTTWDATASAIRGDGGAACNLRIMNVPVKTHPFAFAAKVSTDTIGGGIDSIFSMSDGTSTDDVAFNRNGGGLGYVYDNRTPSAPATQFVVGVASIAHCWADASNVGVDLDGTEITNTLSTADPVVDRSSLMADYAGINGLDGLLHRCAFTADASESERTLLKAWSNA